MPLRRSARSRRQRVRSRLVCLVAKPRISARTDVAQRNRMGSTPERRCGRMPCKGFEAANSYAAEWHPTGNTSLRKSCRGAVLRFHPAPVPFSSTFHPDDLARPAFPNRFSVSAPEHTARNVRQHRTQTTTGSRCNPARLSLNPAIGRERTPAQNRNDKPAPGKGGSTYPDRRTGTG